MSRDWLKNKRIEKKMSMAEVAAKAGIAQGYYSDIENGKRGYQVPVKTAMAIAEVLDFSWNRFYEKGLQNEDHSALGDRHGIHEH